jgi:bifunctional UDP-N-acetylglucosamine pyrophosphorylase / glucosamine-1-phosphate N-acetyltransferase
MSVCAIVLAAGEGRRMNSKKCKFIHKTAGKPVITWVQEALHEAGANEQVYIVGHLQEQVRQVLGEDVAFVLQEKQLGTGHAVMQASPFLEGRLGITLVIRGDSPLITGETLRNVMEYFSFGHFSAVVITADTTETNGYARVILGDQGDVKEIYTQPEQTGKKRDPSDKKADQSVHREKREVFVGDCGMYCFDTALLVSALGRIGSHNGNTEYCLTDVINILIGDGRRVGAYKAPFEETMGVHDKFQLMQVSGLLNRRICRQHMRNGVTITDADSIWIDASVKIRRDAEILPNTILEGNTIIGEDAVIGPNTRITNSVIEDDAVVFDSIVADSVLKAGCCVGPYAYILRGSEIGAHARIGNSVEVRSASVGSYSKALNLALIADAKLGENVSYGCGCITVNFDGNIKNRTTIGENSFIGSNSNLIAPVQIAENTYIAAGSTITDDVPPYGMAIARSHQVVKEEWVLKKNRVRMSRNKT